MPGFTSTLPVPADGNKIFGADILAAINALHALNDALTPYVPTWGSNGTAPSLGNGVITARWTQLGKFLVCRGQILWGSTTTGGTGTWKISLPALALDNTQTGAAVLIDSSTIANRQAGAINLNATTDLTFYSGTGNAVTATTPFAWAVGDSLDWSFIGELA